MTPRKTTGRTHTVSIHVTPEAKVDLDRFKRALAARVDVNVNYSAEIRYLIAVTESAHARQENRRVNGTPPDAFDRAIALLDTRHQMGGKS